MGISRGAVALVGAICLLFGAAIGAGGAYWYLGGEAGGCDQPPRRTTPPTLAESPAGRTPDERAETVVAEAKATAAQIEKSAYASATAVADLDRIAALDWQDGANEMLAAAQEAEIAAHRRAAAIEGQKCLTE